MACETLAREKLQYRLKWRQYLVAQQTKIAQVAIDFSRFTHSKPTHCVSNQEQGNQAIAAMNLLMDNL